MSSHRRGDQRDGNEKELVAFVRAIGGTVVRLTEVDLLVGYKGANYLMEVKKVKEPGDHPSQYDLKPSQREFHASWAGQVCVVRTIKDVADVLGVSFTG